MNITKLDEYQELTRSTAGDDRISTLALGLAGETGEVCDLIKKNIGHGHELDRVKFIEELGDVLWYIARLADSEGLSLSFIASSNIKKLRKRYPDGFSSEKSINREQ